MKRALLFIAVMWLGFAAANGQTTPPISILGRDIVDAIDSALLARTTVADGRLELPIIGYNWSGANNRMTEELHMNAWHYAMNIDEASLPDTTIPGWQAGWWQIQSWHPMQQLRPSMQLIVDPVLPMSNDIGWYTSRFPWYEDIRSAAVQDSLPLHPLHFSHSWPNSLVEGMGVRYHPELDLGSDPTVFVPRAGDRQRAIYGFATRSQLGVTTTSTADVNFDRYVLMQDSFSVATVVLDNSYSDNSFGEWGNRPGDPQSSPFNGRRMYLAVNLRRLAGAGDTIADTAVVLRVRVHYELCSNLGVWETAKLDSLPSHSLNWDIPGDSCTSCHVLPPLPDTSATWRGRTLRLVQAPTDGSLVMNVTREMLPPASAAEPDVTVLGHLVLDGSELSLFDNGIVGYRRNRYYLRSHSALRNDGCNGDLIRRLKVSVEYVGNADVAIDWVDLGTDNYTRLMQGYYDTVALRAARTSLRALDIVNRYDPEIQDTAAKRIRVARWFSRDEGTESRWQAMGYFGMLFSGFADTERGYEHGMVRYRHAVNPSIHWNGFTPQLTSRVAAPYVRRAVVDLDAYPTTTSLERRSRAMNLALGVTSEQMLPYNGNWPLYAYDYELRWGTHGTGHDPLHLPAILNADSLAQAEASSYPMVWANTVSRTHDVSLQQFFEHHRWQLSKVADFMFDTIPWVANPWLHSNWTKAPLAGGDTTVGLTIGLARPLSGEETRLLLWSELILGSKGLMIYKGTAHDSINTFSRYQGTEIGFGSGMPWTNGSNHAVPRHTTVCTAIADTLHTLPVSSTRLGGDFLIPSSISSWIDTYPTTQFMEPGLRLGLREAMGTFYDSMRVHLGLLSGEEVYIGQLSTRLATAEVCGAIHRAAADLRPLRLRGWYHRGYRTWTIADVGSTDTAAIDSLFDVAALRTRHPHRDSAHHWATWDHADSVFAELTVLKAGTANLRDTCVIGVLNRRVNPWPYVIRQVPPDTCCGAPHVDYTVPIPTMASFQDSLRVSPQSRKVAVRYSQHGARQIDIPLRSDNPLTVLRVREIGAERDTAMGYVPIDTIVGASTGLKVDFLPGEGKMFEVTRMSAYAVADSGHLVHSNQRKMVVFPQADSIANLPSDSADACFVVAQDTVDSLGRGFFRMINDTVARYHRVWHTTGIPLTVWYQRSEPVAIDPQSPTSAARTPLLTWEEPILLSGTVVVPPHGGNPIDTLVTPSSGYPAIVVRFNHDVTAQMTRPGNEYYTASGGTPPQVSQTPYARQAVVYVVFTSEPVGSVDTLPNGNMPFYVVEAMLPADMPRAAQVAALAAMPARVIQHVQGKAYNGLMGERPYMWSWGTPMINASADGNWYCWSTNLTQGIGFGFKRPGQLALASTAIVPRANGGTTWRATHPTLNSYSRLHLGERDAAMAWQEGTDAEAGSQIFYTRLRMSAAGAAQHFLTNATTPAPSIGAHVDVLGGNRVRMSSGYGHLAVDSAATLRLSYPTLFRNLSDYEIGVDNSRYDLRLVNHKGDRMWWQARYKYTDSTWGDVLTRKWIDVDNHSARDVSQQDVIASSPQQYMTALTIGSLFTPELSQGEQTTEMYATGQDIVPNPTGPWWQDSVNFMTCRLLGNDLFGGTFDLVVGFTYGWDLYGHGDNTLGGGSGLRVVAHNGILDAIYPHAAARYTNAHMPGYSWNRRIHQTPYAYHGTYHAATTNPDLSQWSAGFFKETPQYQYQIRGFDGFATDEWSLAVANVSVDGSKPLAYGTAASAVDAQASMFARKELKRTSVYASEPFRVDGYRQLDMRVHVIGDMPKGMLAIERLSDGQRFDVEIGDPAAVVQRADELLVPQVVDLSVALVEGKGSEYRLVLNADAPTTLPTQHLELYMPATEDLRKGSEVRRVVNLATGGTATLKGGAVLRIQPQPATDVVTIIVDAGEAARRSGTALTMNVVGAHGSAWHSQQVAATDFVRLDVSSWPAGVYAVTLASHKGVTSTARFVVVR